MTSTPHQVVSEMVHYNPTRFLSAACGRNSVQRASWVALVRIHAGHAALCDLEDAAAQADRVTFAKVASIFTQPLADAGST